MRRTSEDVLRSLKRYVADVMGDEWEVRLSDEEGVFTRPFALIWEAGTETHADTPRWRDVTQPYLIQLYPQPNADPMQSRLDAVRVQETLDSAISCGEADGPGRPLRVPLWDYEEIDAWEAAPAREEVRFGVSGASLHGDYARVVGGGPTFQRLRDDVAEGLWTINCTVRLNWRKPPLPVPDEPIVDDVIVGPSQTVENVNWDIQLGG